MRSTKAIPCLEVVVALILLPVGHAKQVTEARPVIGNGDTVLINGPATMDSGRMAIWEACHGIDSKGQPFLKREIKVQVSGVEQIYDCREELRTLGFSQSDVAEWIVQNNPNGSVTTVPTSSVWPDKEPSCSTAEGTTDIRTLTARVDGVEQILFQSEEDQNRAQCEAEKKKKQAAEATSESSIASTALKCIGQAIIGTLFNVEDILSGIGNTIKNVGSWIGSFFSTPKLESAAARTGEAVTGFDDEEIQAIKSKGMGTRLAEWVMRLYEATEEYVTSGQFFREAVSGVDAQGNQKTLGGVAAYFQKIMGNDRFVCWDALNGSQKAQMVCYAAGYLLGGPYALTKLPKLLGILKLRDKLRSTTLYKRATRNIAKRIEKFNKKLVEFEGSSIGKVAKRTALTLGGMASVGSNGIMPVMSLVASKMLGIGWRRIRPKVNLSKALERSVIALAAVKTAETGLTESKGMAIVREQQRQVDFEKLRNGGQIFEVQYLKPSPTLPPGEYHFALSNGKIVAGRSPETQTASVLAGPANLPVATGKIRVGPSGSIEVVFAGRQSPHYTEKMMEYMSVLLSPQSSANRS